MRVTRIIAWVLLALACLALGAELLRSLEAGSWQPQALGLLWYNLDRESLNLVQAVIQRYLFPALWDPVIATALLWPAWVLPGGLGLLLLLTVRPRKKKRRWFSR